MSSTENNGRVKLAVIARDIDYIKKAIDDIRKNYVTQQEFKPVRLIVYGFAAIVLTAVVGAVIALVLK